MTEIGYETLCKLYSVIITGFSISEPVPDYVKAVVDTVMVIHEHEPLGDVLAFLTGQEEVDRAVSLLKEQVVDSKNNCKLHFRVTRFVTGDMIKVFMYICICN
jgi:ATP-dependent RNA helicase DDX35